MNFNDNITKNFTWNEFFKSYTANRYNINNYTLNETIFTNIKSLTENVLQPLRNKFGSLKILSGYRCEKLNKIVSGSPYSNHMLGEAVDIEPYNDISLIDIITYINKQLPYRELIGEFLPDGWVHVAYRKNGNDKILKLKDVNHNYNQVTLKYIQELYG